MPSYKKKGMIFNMSEEKFDKKDNKDNKDIEVVSGDGTNLNISPVYDNTSATRPKTQNEKPKNIVVPKPKK
jgi:hypothetical protein